MELTFNPESAEWRIDSSPLPAPAGWYLTHLPGGIRLVGDLGQHNTLSGVVVATHDSLIAPPAIRSLRFLFGIDLSHVSRHDVVSVELTSDGRSAAEGLWRRAAFLAASKVESEPNGSESTQVELEIRAHLAGVLLPAELGLVRTAANDLEASLRRIRDPLPEDILASLARIERVDRNGVVLANRDSGTSGTLPATQRLRDAIRSLSDEVIGAAQDLGRRLESTSSLELPSFRAGGVLGHEQPNWSPTVQVAGSQAAEAEWSRIPDGVSVRRTRTSTSDSDRVIRVHVYGPERQGLNRAASIGFLPIGQESLEVPTGVAVSRVEAEQLTPGPSSSSSAARLGVIAASTAAMGLGKQEWLSCGAEWEKIGQAEMAGTAYVYASIARGEVRDSPIVGSRRVPTAEAETLRYGLSMLRPTTAERLQEET